MDSSCSQGHGMEVGDKFCPSCGSPASPVPIGRDPRDEGVVVTESGTTVVGSFQHSHVLHGAATSTRVPDNMTPPALQNEARQRGKSTVTMFTDWLVQDQEWFGDPASLSPAQLIHAKSEARRIWNSQSVSRVRRRDWVAVAARD